MIVLKELPVVTSHSVNAPYRTRFSADGYEAYSDASEAKGGTGAGFGPHALLAGSVACCMNIWLRMYADKNGIPLREVVAVVRLNRQSSAVTVFEYSVELRGELTPVQRHELRQQLVNWPVSQSLL